MKADDPIGRFNDALARAKNAGIEFPNAMSLATVGLDGRPSLRIVLLKQADERGFVFYTNLGSRKARELERNPRAALCFWWPAIEEQVRVEGSIRLVDDEDADDYFASRPRESQLSAWASRQSDPLSSREKLLENVGALEAKYAGKDIPRPPFWSGFVLVPAYFEFWLGRPDRLHERFAYELEDERWMKTMLYP